MNRKSLLSLVCGGVLLAGPQFFTSPTAAALPGVPQTIFQIVQNSDDFDTLEVALTTANLDGVLDGTDRFTVFAPTDAAFELLGMETINALLADVPTLDLILKYHVLAGDVPASQVTTSTFLTTLADQRVDITLQGSDAFVDGVKISTVDVPAANGIVHIIDAVLQPNTRKLLETAGDLGFSTLDTAVGATMLGPVLDGDGPFTVFAPDDAAFNLLPPSGLNSLVTTQVDLLSLVLQYHVVPGRLYADQVTQVSELTTVLGAKLQVRNVGGVFFINGSRLTQTDVETRNGNIHVINKVLGGERLF